MGKARIQEQEASIYFITPEISMVPPSLFPHSQGIHEHNVLVTYSKKSQMCLLRYWKVRVEGSHLEKHQHFRKM